MNRRSLLRTFSCFASCVLLLASAAYGQTAWEEVARLATPDHFRDLATDGRHLVLGLSNPGMAQVYGREAGGWVVEDSLLGGGNCAVEDDWIAVTVGGSGGFVRLYQDTPSGWELVQTLFDPTPGGSYGRDLVLENGVLVVGDPMLGDGTSSDVHVYLLESGQWILAQTIPGPAAAGGDDAFGLRVALSGSRLAVSAPAWTSTGSVFVYERTVGPFVEVDLIQGPIGTKAFGAELDLLDNTLLVGSTGQPPFGGVRGSLNIYEHSRGAWHLARRMTDPDADPESGFGLHLALGRDVVAASSPYGGVSLPPAKIFTLHRIGGRWVRTGRIDSPTSLRNMGDALGFVGPELLATSRIVGTTGYLHQFRSTFARKPAVRPRGR